MLFGYVSIFVEFMNGLLGEVVEQLEQLEQFAPEHPSVIEMTSEVVAYFGIL